MAELLKLLQILCVSPNKLPSSFFQLKEILLLLDTIIVKYVHYVENVLIIVIVINLVLVL